MAAAMNKNILYIFPHLGTRYTFFFLFYILSHSHTSYRIANDENVFYIYLYGMWKCRIVWQKKGSRIVMAESVSYKLSREMCINDENIFRLP